MLGGCLKTLGCGTLLLIAAGGAWLTRDRWLPALRDGRDSTVVEAPGSTLTDSGAQRAENRIRSLGRPTGPAYVNVAPEDLAALIVREAGRNGPLPIKDASAHVIDERLVLRGTLDLRQLNAKGALGALASLLGDEERVELTGTLDIVQPGMAQFLVERFKVRDIAIPSRTIPGLLDQIYRGRRPAAVSRNGVPFPVPTYIGDARIANGQVTLYKTVDGPR